MSRKSKQLVNLQSCVRGHLCRRQNEGIVNKIKKESVKKTPKYRNASKIQALVKGFLFRKRRKNALARLAQNKKQEVNQKDQFDGEDDIFAEENMAKDFDVEAFFEVKQENLEAGDIFAGASESLMDKYVEMMGSGQTMSP